MGPFILFFIDGPPDNPNEGCYMIYSCTEIAGTGYTRRRRHITGWEKDYKEKLI
jgi:hypothetical protein